MSFLRSKAVPEQVDEAEVDGRHQFRMVLLKAWLIGLSVSIFAVACTLVAHTPLELAGMVLSVPMLPCILHL